MAFAPPLNSVLKVYGQSLQEARDFPLLLNVKEESGSPIYIELKMRWVEDEDLEMLEKHFNVPLSQSLACASFFDPFIKEKLIALLGLFWEQLSILEDSM